MFSVDELNAPLTINLALTNKCNLNCIYCYNDFPPKIEDNTIESEEIDFLLDQIIDIRIFQVILGGGEPFLNRNLKNIVDKLCKNNISTCITTNGTQFKNSDYKWLKEYIDNYSLKLQISLDSYDSTINDQIRGEGELVKKNIKRLLENNIKISIGSVLTKYNIEYIDKQIEKYFPKIKFFHFMPLMNSYKAKSIYYPSDIQIKKFSKTINSLKNKYGKELQISMFYDESKIKLINASTLRYKGCSACKTRIDVDYYLNVRACNVAYKSIIGNLKESNLKDIWVCEKAKNYRNYEYPVCIN